MGKSVANGVNAQQLLQCRSGKQLFPAIQQAMSDHAGRSRLS